MKKPQPPDNLWERMDAIREATGCLTVQPGWFSTIEYADRYGINRRTAAEQLQKLSVEKKIQRMGLVKGQTYYKPL